MSEVGDLLEDATHALAMFDSLCIKSSVFWLFEECEMKDMKSTSTSSGGAALVNISLCKMVHALIVLHRT